MLTADQQSRYRAQCLALLARGNITLRPDEAKSFELADLGLNNFESEGLGLVVYVNTDRYCGKELILLPRQTCPQHRHPPIGGGADPGKMETFRCRWGKVYLYVEGPPTSNPACRAPKGKEPYYTVWHQVELNPGDQHTIPPNTWHWFQSGPEGALITEFSSTSRDEFDQFPDPAIRRVG